VIRDSNRSKRVYPAFRRRVRPVASAATAIPKVVMNNSFCERGSVTSLFYVPWTSQSESSSFNEEVSWIPPFGANTTIASVFIYAQSAGGSTTVTIRDSSLSVLATSTVTMSAQTLHEFVFDYPLNSADIIAIGVEPTTRLDSVRTQILAQETVAS